jgi:tyrosyl-tRNA synthetase
MEGVPTVEIEKEKFNDLDLITLLTETKILPSKSEAKKMVAGGGIFINKEKALSPDEKISPTRLLNNKYLLIQKGKKNYYLFKVL